PPPPPADRAAACPPRCCARPPRAPSSPPGCGGPRPPPSCARAPRPPAAFARATPSPSPSPADSPSTPDRQAPRSDSPALALAAPKVVGTPPSSGAHAPLLELGLGVGGRNRRTAAPRGEDDADQHRETRRRDPETLRSARRVDRRSAHELTLSGASGSVKSGSCRRRAHGVPQVATRRRGLRQPRARRRPAPARQLAVATSESPDAA